ncbi:hypothetical protein MAR_012464 [Mya arenaria]|uniref:Uncharacterized protein n=1 Tax=Mya arenaria TaxID=6604 RepID=A0ABY7FXP7_MYAAR|nr:hypothetical protein MAR_012464 [Mya arenaria]
MAGVSRAQMVSSDGPRYSGNRRPSMQTENIFVTETSQARLDAANARLELQPEMAHGPTRVEYGAVRSQPQRSDHYDRRHSNTRSSRHLHHDDMPNGSTRLSEMRHEPLVSAEYYNRPRDDYPDDPQSESTNNPVYRRGAVARLPTPQVVVDQPYPGISYEEIDRQRRRRQAGTNRRARIMVFRVAKI